MSAKLCSRVLAIVCTVTLGLAAQRTSASTSQADYDRTGMRLTVTGCLQRSSEIPVGTSGTIGNANRPTTEFVLTNVAPPSAGAAAKRRTAPSTSAPLLLSIYGLDAKASVLAPQVGQLVEIAGTVEQPESVTSTGSVSTGPTSDTKSSAISQTTLKVESLRLISPSCR